MPPRNWLIRIQDMLDASALVVEFTHDFTDIDVFASDTKTVHAVLHNIQIIGEAAPECHSDV
jgi:uncharacterized protein with HEPN domain